MIFGNMIVFPNAKINLGLDIVSRRQDGYHNINTIFFPIPICDVLEISEPMHPDLPCSKITLHLNGMKPDGKLNLVEKAYYAINAIYPLPSIEVYLKKNIPYAAGLGGGSSDAAFMLRALAEKYSLPVKPEQLHDIASGIGADCPFFLNKKPLFAEGIGTQFSEIDVNLRGKYISVIKPLISISTADAYAGVIPSKPDKDIRDIISEPIYSWKNLLKNDFERSLFLRYPLLEEIKRRLYFAGADYASMSGSGSAIFGIFDNRVEFRELFSDVSTRLETILTVKIPDV